MPRSISEQVVVIVGASSGIGRAGAVAFARSGARVVCAARSVDALDSLVEEISTAGGTALALPTDVADPAAVRRLAAAAQESYGRIDTWVNAAAVGIWGRVEDITDEEFDRVMRVNFLGHVHCIHAALPVMRQGDGGVIIGISSVEGVRSVPLHSPYTASKWAVRALYDSLRAELAQEGAPIAVSTVLPASIDTPFFEHARSKLGAMPKPPPPVYAPELVAEAILRAAEHPRREIPVGGAAFGFIVGQRFAPALTDALLSIPRLGAGSQKSDRPDQNQDNLDAPMAGTGRVHGAYSGRVLTRSTFTRVASRLPRPGELASVAVSRVQQLRHHDQSENEDRPENQQRPEEQDRVGGPPGGPSQGENPVPTLNAAENSRQDVNSENPIEVGKELGSDQLTARERKLSGWGGNEGPELSAEQVAGLQEHEEPVAAANFGEALTGDLGRAELADEAVNAPETRKAPETRQQDTVLGPKPADAALPATGDGAEPEDRSAS